MNHKLIIYFFFISISLSAQQLSLKTYTRSEGLSSDYILSLFQDNRGFLWIGTDRGVSRYDGTNFRNFTIEDGLSSNLIYCIFQSSDGAMWFGTYKGGACRFDGKNFKAITLKDGLPSNTINAITQDRFGRMYFETSLGTVMERKNKFFRVFDYKGGTARPLLRLRDGTILVPDSSRLYEITPTDDDHILKKTITTAPSAKINFYDMNSTAAIERNNGEIVLASAHKLLFMQRTDFGWRIRIKKERDRETLGVGEDRAGGLWFGGQFGISHIIDERISTYGLKNGIDPPFVKSLLVDREGIIWIGTFGGGLKKIIDDQIRIFTDKEGLVSNNVNTVFPDLRGKIWIGTKRLGNVIVNNAVFPVRFQKKYSNDQIRAFGEDSKGTVYVGGFNFFFRIVTLSETTFDAFRVPEFKTAFSGIATINSYSNKSELWLGTYGEGVINFLDGKIKQITTDDGIVSDIIENISHANDGLWFLSRNNGASFYHKGIIKNYSEAEGLPSKTLFCVHQDDDKTIWFGSNKGLIRINGKEIRLYGKKEGLIGTSVLAIIKDTSKNSVGMWIVSDRALHRFENDKFLSYASFSILPSEKTIINQVTYHSSKNQLWLATTSGAVKIDLSAVRRIDIAPLIHVTKVYTDEFLLFDELSMLSSSNKLRHFVLPFNKNTISFSYTSTCFAREEEVKYQYKLEGEDDHWSQPTQERTIRYHNLPNGEYTFLVMAINPDGIKSTSFAKILITITPPFWKEWWFLVLTSIAFLFVIIRIVKYYSTRKLKKQIYQLEKEKAVQKERDRISRDLHDNIGAQLTNIITGIGLAEIYNKTEKAKADNLLYSLKNEVKEIMTQLRETIRTLKSNEMNYDNWIMELQKIIEKHSKYFSGEIVLNTAIDSTKEIILSPLQSLHLLRIVQEAIINSIKHSGAKNIIVKVNYEDEKLFISVKDNGSGLKDEKYDLLNGNGIENMKKRVEEIGAKINFVSEKNTGVSVNIISVIERKK